MESLGLEGVVVAETALSRVDGEAGTLVLRGLPLHAVSGVLPFESVCHLMWRGEPTGPEALRSALGAARAAAFEQLPRLGDALERPDAMDALRAAVAHLSASASPEVMLTGAMATYAGAWARRQRGEAPLAPDPDAGHAADLLRMISGATPTPRAATALDAYLATVVDHGLNASTFAARVIASTASDPVSAVVGALGALKGKLHGGAPGPVLDMLDAIETPERAEGWIRAELAAGRRIMGMGHRVYRVRDPRAAALERALAGLTGQGQPNPRLELARAVEHAAERVLTAHRPGRVIRANVEFYTATLLEALGVPRAMFTAIFAASRVVGWCAHIAEQQATGRLMRPRARYVGPVAA